MGDYRNIWMWSLSDFSSPPARLDLPVSAQGVEELAFSDNDWLIARSSDQVVRLWRLDLADLVDVACQALGRMVSLEELKLYLPAEKFTEEAAIMCRAQSNQDAGGTDD